MTRSFPKKYKIVADLFRFLIAVELNHVFRNTFTGFSFKGSEIRSLRYILAFRYRDNDCAPLNRRSANTVDPTASWTIPVNSPKTI